MMTTATRIPPDTLLAYRATNYRILRAPPFIMRVDVPCPALAALHADHGVACSAFLTACNPCSQIRDAAENASRQKQLAQALEELGLPALPGVGEHPDGRWPGEESFLVPGLSLPAACELGRRFEQNALLWADANCIPTLILLR